MTFYSRVAVLAVAALMATATFAWAEPGTYAPAPEQKFEVSKEIPLNRRDQVKENVTERKANRLERHETVKENHLKRKEKRVERREDIKENVTERKEKRALRREEIKERHQERKEKRQDHINNMRGEIAPLPDANRE